MDIFGPLVQKVIGSLVRLGLGALGGWLLAHAQIDATQWETWVEATALIAGAGGWAVIRHVLAHQKETR